MDAGYFWDHSYPMTAIVILTVLLLLAIAGPLFGADSRSSRGWKATEPNEPLWSEVGLTAGR